MFDGFVLDCWTSNVWAGCVFLYPDFGSVYIMNVNDFYMKLSHDTLDYSNTSSSIVLEVEHPWIMQFHDQKPWN